VATFTSTRSLITFHTLSVETMMSNACIFPTSHRLSDSSPAVFKRISIEANSSNSSEFDEFASVGVRWKTDDDEAQHPAITITLHNLRIIGISEPLILRMNETTK